MRRTKLLGGVDITSQNSVYLEDCTAADEKSPAAIKWRSPTNLVCLATSGAGKDRVYADPNGKFGLCNSRWHLDYLGLNYDTSKDLFLDKFEFLDRLHGCLLDPGGGLEQAGRQNFGGLVLGCIEADYL